MRVDAKPAQKSAEKPAADSSGHVEPKGPGARQEAINGKATAAEPAPVKKAKPGKNERAAGLFLKELVVSPGTVGAIAPSSPRLAREMVAGSDVHEARCVIEYGPGAGAFTGEILRQKPKDCKYFAIELSSRLAERYQARFPDARLYLGSAVDAPELCRREGLSGHNCVDIVYSGLPFASFGADLQTQIIERTIQVLKPGGLFVTFAYAGFSALTPAGQRIRRLFPKHFAKVSKGKTIWGNVPPAFVFRCIK